MFAQEHFAATSLPAQGIHIVDVADQVSILEADHVPVLISAHHSSIITAKRSEEHTSELQSPCNLVCRLLLEKKPDSRISIVPSGSPSPPCRRQLSPNVMPLLQLVTVALSNVSKLPAGPWANVFFFLMNRPPPNSSPLPPPAARLC